MYHTITLATAFGGVGLLWGCGVRSRNDGVCRIEQTGGDVAAEIGGWLPFLDLDHLLLASKKILSLYRPVLAKRLEAVTVHIDGYDVAIGSLPARLNDRALRSAILNLNPLAIMAVRRLGRISPEFDMFDFRLIRKGNSLIVPSRLVDFLLR